MRKRFFIAPPALRMAAFFLREYFFPFGCSVCGAGLVGAEESWRGLCAGCRAELEAWLEESAAAPACARCGRPLVSEREICLSCRAGEGRGEALPDRSVALFPYAGRYRAALAAYKFGKNLALGNFFAEKALAALEGGALSPGAGFGAEACVVPVPPRPGKLRETGWDQVEYLARAFERQAGKTGGWKVSRCLRRLPSESQKALGLEGRRANLRGRIVPSRRAPETAIVLDDVMTTGSTLAACASALREAGAKTVYGLCLFYSAESTGAAEPRGSQRDR